MKTRAARVIFLFLGLLFISEIQAQTVKVCISINGTAMPVSKTWQICRKNNLTANSAAYVTLISTNCAATPEINVSYKWRNLSVAPVDSIGNIVTVKDTGRWEATITNNVTSLVYKDTLHLVYYNPISVTMNDGTYVTGTHGCPLTPYTLTTNSTGSITGYQWFSYSPKDTVEGATGSSYLLQKRNTYYIVEAHDSHNCYTADTSVYFNGLPSVNINLGPDPAIFCEGNTFAIKSTVTTGFPGSPTGIQWGIDSSPLGTANTGLTNPPAPINVVPPSGTHKFWLKIDQFPLCSNADTVVVSTKPIPVVDLGAASIPACYASNTTLTPTVTMSTGTLTYTWTSVPPSVIPPTSSVSVSPSVNTTYTVKVRDANNCGDGIDNQILNVNPQIFTSASNDTTICKDPQGIANLKATASGGTGAITYAWTPVTGLSSTNTLNTTATISYDVTYTFTATDANNCNHTEQVVVTSYEPPVAPITNPTLISETKTATLEASFSGNAGSTFLWKTDSSPTSLSSTSSLYLEYQGPDTVRYVVIVTNPSNGCVNKDTIQVWSISDNTLMYIPNVFSPNASNTENQTLKIYGSNLLPDGFKWIVYNKWGNLMYETTDLMEAQSQGWDGGAMIEGVYTYVIVGKFKNGKDVKESPYYKGTFSLIK